MSGSRVLVVDDDPKIRTLLRRCLEAEGFGIDEAEDEPSALEQLGQRGYDLVTLDLDLGEGDGLNVMRRIRQSSDIPVIMVTGKDELIDRVVGLEIGADDYITKPFHLREVVARVRTVLRRFQKTQHKNDALEVDAMTFDGLTARPDRFELLDRDGQLSDLTAGDFKLLSVFLSNPKRILSRERIMDLLEGPDWTPLDRTVDNQVARLRKKIERDPTNPQLIKTVRGVGYMLATDVTLARSQSPAKTS